MKNKNRNVSAFLELMRSGIWGKMPDTTFFEELTEFDWLEIYMIAGKQTVLGICLKPIMDLPDRLKPPTKLLLQWVGLNRYIEAKNYKMLQVWKELDSKFTAAGITPVLFKGISVAKWYAHPMSRQSSDVDIFIPEKFNEAIQLVKSWGLKCKHKPQHDTIYYKDVLVEIHSNIINSPFKPQLHTTIKDDVFANDNPIRVTDADTYSLMLLSHAAGHFLIPGIGYRFLCDWAVFLQHNYEAINCDFVLREAKRMGMQRFVIEFTKLAEVHLGVNFKGLDQWTKGSNSKYLWNLSDELFEQGDFGAVNFQKNFHGSRIKLGWHILKSLFASRYYWPRLFWRRAPKYLYKLAFKKYE